MWISRIEFDLVPLIELLVYVFILLNALDMAYSAVFEKKAKGAEGEKPCC